MIALKVRYCRALILVAVSSRRNVGAAQIMYKAFLSYIQMKKYVSILIAAGLIKYQEGNLRTYRITDKGIKFLDLHNTAAVRVS